MPTVNGKKYPYTTAGKLAAKKAGAGKALSNAGLKRDNAGRKTKAAVKGMLKPRTPAQMRKMKAGMANATKKRKAGKGQQK